LVNDHKLTVLVAINNLCEISGHVQGQHLQRGSRLEDFVIFIGDAECVPDSLTDNEVQCQPPTFVPNNVNYTSCPEFTLSMHVGIRYFYETVTEYQKNTLNAYENYEYQGNYQWHIIQ